MSDSNDFSRRINRLFDRTLRSVEGVLDEIFDEIGDSVEDGLDELKQERRTVSATPLVNKSGKTVTIQAPVPGADSSDVQVVLEGRILSVSCAVRRVSYKFKVSPLTRPENITASVKNGLATIVINYDEQTQPDRKVKINVG